MTSHTTIAAAIYRHEPNLTFGDIVATIETTLRAKTVGRRSLTFDHDDLVIVEVDNLCIGLAWIAPAAPS